MRAQRLRRSMALHDCLESGAMHMETRDYWFYTAGLAVVVALVALAGCSKVHAQFDLPFPVRTEARAAAGDIVQGTVRSVLAAPEPEEAWERTHLSYEDPLDEAPREQVVVRLDDGSEVTLLYAGPRDIQAGERVRVYLGEDASFLL